ncbi:hypothetical protein Rhal01_01318 [Rubritalea halochordaticola]|uniref:DUF6985 domain-containing protein n=1 Tax=Rubritalea halochordaticola TaxID=714537 RepID=A0ABP9UXF9_9BACT
MKFLREEKYDGERIYSIPEIATFGRRKCELTQRSNDLLIKGMADPNNHRQRENEPTSPLMTFMMEEMPDRFPDTESIYKALAEDVKYVKMPSSGELENEIKKHHKDLSLITVFDESCEEWGEAQEQQLNQIVEDWPAISAALRSEVFGYYKKHYTDFFEHEHGHAPESGRILMPEPTEETIIDELFTIGTINIEKGSDCIGLSGGCTWESEHGFGALIEGTQVIAVGSADISFGIPSENVAYAKGESLENQN